MARIRSVSSFQRVPLTEGWQLVRSDPGSETDVAAIASRGLLGSPAQVPGTVASALRAEGRWEIESARDLDGSDWWYGCAFAAAELAPGCRATLRIGGLATIADVWLNGVHLLRSENMFTEHAIDVSAILRKDAPNELYILFRALAPLFAERRPRPRWRTRLVEAQQLRWFRTTLLGRMPGWCPKAPPVGPYRPITLEVRRGIADVGARLAVGPEHGAVHAALRVQTIDGAAIEAARITVGDQDTVLHIENQSNGTGILRGSLRVRDAEPWWPHTHGAQPLYPVRAYLRLTGLPDEVAIDCGRIGFRNLELVKGAGEDFALRINGARIFCRGACWTPLDSVSLGASEAAYREALQLVRAAGMNMLRLPGNMSYEAPIFHELCDELGILVWQEFMFANMDYPSSEPFTASVRDEAGQLLDRLEGSPSLTVLCGGSEVEQQAAMLGLPREQWTSPLFGSVLPERCRELRPDVPYIPSSPSGGELPFQANSGVTHYYGVGAYMRPLEDARRAEVRFAAECLAFANVPEESTLVSCFSSTTAIVHHPKWKAAVPRDPGAGWDFEDVRDHYLRLLFGEDAARLRYSDHARYLQLSRLVTGEVMASAFAEWRRQRSTCNGALVWLYRDLVPGAGWGVVDALGTPKASYYYLRRVLQPICLFLSDEGLNGLHIHVANETAQARELRVRVALYRHGEQRISDGEMPVTVPARGAIELPMSRLFGAFVDTTYAYRFGPPAHDLTVASLQDEQGAPIGSAFHFPIGFPPATHHEPGLTAVAQRREDGTYLLTVRALRFAQSVCIEVAGFLPEDNYFHLEPYGQRTVILSPRTSAPARAFRGTVGTANSTATPVRIEVRAEGSP